MDKALLPGRYRIRISHTGYQTLDQVESIIVNHMGDQKLSFTLKP